MKLNPKHHNPELLEEIDEYYYYDHDCYDSCFYDDYYDEEYSDYYYEDHWIKYTWLIHQDRVTTITENIKNYSEGGGEGYDVYELSEGDYEYEIYSFASNNKTLGFFGTIHKAIIGTKNPSPKLKKIYDILADRYPELYIKLLDLPI